MFDDEPRDAAVFSPEYGRAAAAAILTLTGVKLLHEGQFEGRKVRPPIFLGRRPAASTDQDFAAFHARLLKETAHDVFRNGTWRLCDALSGEIYDRSGDDMIYNGLYVDLRPWGYYVFAVCEG